MADEPTNIVEIPRKKNGQFQKGVSGNPLGSARPRVYRDLDGQKREIQDLFREGAPAVFEIMLRMIHDSKTPPGVKANLIKEYFNRAVGKPAITIMSPEQENYDGLDFAKLDDDALSKVMTLIAQNGDE
jgi:hypothetical protein